MKQSIHKLSLVVIYCQVTACFTSGSSLLFDHVFLRKTLATKDTYKTQFNDNGVTIV